LVFLLPSFFKPFLNYKSSSHHPSLTCSQPACPRSQLDVEASSQVTFDNSFKSSKVSNLLLGFLSFAFLHIPTSIPIIAQFPTSPLPPRQLNFPLSPNCLLTSRLLPLLQHIFFLPLHSNTISIFLRSLQSSHRSVCITVSKSFPHFQLRNFIRCTLVPALRHLHIHFLCITFIHCGVVLIGMEVQLS